MSRKTSTQEALDREFEALKKLPVGSDEYNSCVTTINKLSNILLDIEKVESQEYLDTVEKDRLYEIEYEKNHILKMDKILEHSIAVVGIATTSAITIWGVLKSLKFEESGTLTTIVGKSFFNNLFRR